ncbi:hypothetical protein ACWCYY_33030 [Kitasatospora sp. NPDC001664]
MHEKQDHGQADAEVNGSNTTASAEADTAVFVCATCGVPLTGPLTRLPEVPEAPYYEWWEADQPGPSPPTVPSGHYAIETEPYGGPQGPRGNIVINPDDARGLELRHASSACCGATPNGGMNQLCVCGTLVATLSSDCCYPYELHLSADHVRAVPA